MNVVFTLLYGRPEVLKWLGRKGEMRVAFIVQVVFYVFYLFFHHSVIGYHTGADSKATANFKPPDNKDEMQTPGAGSYLACPLGACLFAIGDAVWESQVPAILQGYFQENRDLNCAMANMKMWQSLGFAAQFAIGVAFSGYDDVLDFFWLKVAILLTLLVLSYVCVVIVGARHPVDDVTKEDKSEAESSLIA